MLEVTLQQTRVYQEVKAEGEAIGEQRGRQEERRSLVLRQLTRRLGELPELVRSPIEALTLDQLGNLAESLLDFTNLADLEQWLAALTDNPNIAK